MGLLGIDMRFPGTITCLHSCQVPQYLHALLVHAQRILVALHRLLQVLVGAVQQPGQKREGLSQRANQSGTVWVGDRGQALGIHYVGVCKQRVNKQECSE